MKKLWLMVGLCFLNSSVVSAKETENFSVALRASTDLAPEIVTSGGKCAYEKLFSIHQIEENNDLPREIGTKITQMINAIGWRVIFFPNACHVWMELESNADSFALPYLLQKNSNFEFVFNGIRFRSNVYPSKLNNVSFQRIILSGEPRAAYRAKVKFDKFVGLCETNFTIAPLLDADEKVVFVDPKYLNEPRSKKSAILIMGTRVVF